VNEGLIEWPPSPWRLLRAIVAAGYNHGLWPGGGPPETARSLIGKLAAVLPRYRLPQAVGAHSRHYMPLARFKDGREETTLVFDTFARVENGVLAASWDVELTPEESELLGRLAERMGYLGRSESWIEGRLAAAGEPPPEGLDCYPSGDPPPLGWEQVPLLAPLDEATYSRWREEQAAGLRQGDAVPKNLIDCLQRDTAWLQKQGWSQPPGSRRVFYLRPSNAIETGSPRLRPPPAADRPVEAMLLCLSHPTRNDHALPPVARTLPQAELLHRALVRRAEVEGSSHCPALTGCDAQGRPLRGPHSHAHILPLDLDNDGHLDHYLIWASMGLDFVARSSVRSVRRTYGKKSPHPLQLTLAGSGSLDDLRAIPESWGEGLRRVLGAGAGATRWRSLSPFVPPRHLKKRGRDTLEGQVRAELASRGLPPAREMLLLDPQRSPEAMRQRHFVRLRRKGPPPPIDCGFTLELVFDEPVRGPICLGYASHFGLGLFGTAD
jgi:CRISPR-associated protein Csb2